MNPWLKKSSASLLLGLLLPSMALASDDWTWTTEPTPGTENEIAIDPDSETNPSYSNGTLSTEILLSEIMPDPEGTDTETEWIELYNMGTVDVDLGNWSLDDEEGGSQPYTFPAGTRIEAQDFLVVTRADSNLALNNDADEVRLFDFEGTLQDSVNYESAPEAQSYARISFESSAPVAERGGWLTFWIPTASAKEIPAEMKNLPWSWTEDVTQGTLNPLYQWIEGTITELLPFENKIMIDGAQGPFALSLEKLNMDETLKAIVFQPGNAVKGYASATQNHTLELKKIESYELLASPSSSFNALKTGLLMVSLVGIGAVAWWHHKKAQSERIAPPQTMH